ncbi:MAG: hypothetical protein E7652_06985 [Ruminococcaceae bacterium]|nr:hypothetical protein [Oscillospiraceae bacterium]
MGIERLSEFWPEWQVTDLLGEGSFGKVYKAEKSDTALTSYSAIKVISIPNSQAEIRSLYAEGMTDADTTAYLEGVVSDFVNEIKLMENLKSASNIVTVEDYKILKKNDGIGWDIFIRMELLESFEKVMAKKTLSEDEVIKLAIDLCTALEACEKDNIIHRDIKPANIFVSRFGDYKIGDFGVAKELSKTVGNMSSKGTLSYMAPEVVHGQNYDATADIYSLGIVLYALLNNNRLPFLDPNSTQITYNDRQAASERRLSGEPLPKPCNASGELASIVLTACSYDPKRRFKRPAAMKNALLAYKNSKSGVFVATAAPKPASDYDATLSAANSVNRNTQTNNPSVKAEAPKSVKSPKAKRSGRKTGVIIAVALLVVAIAAACVFVLPGLLDNSSDAVDNDDEKTEEKKESDEKDNDEKDDKETVKEGIEWSCDGDVFTVSGIGPMTDFAKLDDVEWKELQDKVTEVIIEEGVTSVGDRSFSYFENLSKVTLPETLERIGDFAFFECSNINELIIPDKVTYIGERCFTYCGSLSKVNIPKGVEEIKESTFDGASSITTLEIPDTVTKIGKNAFYNCFNLTALTLPDSITSIGENAFMGCSKLVISCSSGSTAETYAKDNDIAFKIVVLEGSKVDTEPITGQTTWDLTSGTLTIGGVGEMDNYSWGTDIPWQASREEIKTIVIESGVTSVGDYAFESCTKVTSVTIPDTVTSIGKRAFYDCESLTSLTLPDAITFIGNGAFYFCDKLTSVNIPTSVKTIDEDAFNYCKAITALTLPEGLTKIGASAFESCESVQSIAVPSTVTEIGESAFQGMYALTSLTVAEGNTAYTSENNILYDKNKTTVYAYALNSMTTSITIPATVKTISDQAFYHAEYLTSVVISEGVESIGFYSFGACRKLASITLPSTLVTIGDNAFNYCEALNSITFPSALVSIGEEAFYDCNSLTTVSIPAGVTHIGIGAFYYCDKLTAINVDAANTMYTSVDGVLFNKDKTIMLAYPSGKPGDSYVVPSTVTAIEKYAIYFPKNLLKLTIPASVLVIDDYGIVIYSWSDVKFKIIAPAGSVGESFAITNEFDYSNS